jgi:hypothetical protein
MSEKRRSNAEEERGTPTLASSFTRATRNGPLHPQERGRRGESKGSLGNGGIKRIERDFGKF